MYQRIYVPVDNSDTPIARSTRHSTSGAPSARSGGCHVYAAACTTTASSR